MAQPANNTLSLSKDQLSQFHHQQQQPIPNYPAQTYDPSTYYHQNQQQNPNFAYYQPHYPPTTYQGNYQAAPGQGGQIGYSGVMEATGEKMTWQGQGQSNQGAGQFIGPVAQPENVGGGGSRGGRRSGRGRGGGRGRGRAAYVAEPQQPKLIGPLKSPGQTFHCELCKIDCTALDLLNQHKNGKKHKKNLEKSGQLPKPETLAIENPSFEKPLEAVNPPGDLKRGIKRKMRGGRNGKGTKKLNEQSKVVIPIICELCFVKCDTQEVYERHVAGKKHNSKLKRYEGHHNMYGPEGLQVLYPPMAQKLVSAQDPNSQQAYPNSQGQVPQPELQQNPGPNLS